MLNLEVCLASFLEWRLYIFLLKYIGIQLFTFMYIILFSLIFCKNNGYYVKYINYKNVFSFLILKWSILLKM